MTGSRCEGGCQPVDAGCQVGVGGFERGVRVDSGWVGHRPVQPPPSGAQFFVRLIADGNDEVVFPGDVAKVGGAGCAQVEVVPACDANGAGMYPLGGLGAGGGGGNVTASWPASSGGAAESMG
jgi:hypothetical protein